MRDISEERRFEITDEAVPLSKTEEEQLHVSPERSKFSGLLC